MKKIALVLFVSIILAAGSAYACEGNCKTILSTSGNHSQLTSAVVDTATVKKGVILDGSQAVAVGSTKGTYTAPKGGVGVTAGIGISTSTATNTRKTASAQAMTANAGISAVSGRDACATLKGSGEAVTVAVKDFKNASGAAQTSGSFKYNAKGQVLAGAGVTGGSSNVVTGKNTVTSTAGHITASGVIGN